ncbi:MAG: alpha/beta hydrolase [Myxococcota bacterium]
MKERFVTLRGMDFCVGEWGAPTDPPVVILHGWLDQILAWDRIATRIAAHGHRVLAFEQRGHGRSAHAPPGGYYHFPNYIADFDAFVRAEGLTDFTLIGHSMGGTVSSNYTAFRSDRVRHLILIDGLGPPAIDDDTAVRQYGRHLDQLADPPAQKILESIEDGIRRLKKFNPSLPDDEARRLAERVLEPLPGGAYQWRWDPLHKIRSPMPFDVDRHYRVLKAIGSPVTLMFGADSWYLQLPDLETRVALFGDMRGRILLDTGHSPHMENPERLMAALTPVL